MAFEKYAIYFPFAIFIAIISPMKIWILLQKTVCKE